MRHSLLKLWVANLMIQIGIIVFFRNSILNVIPDHFNGVGNPDTFTTGNNFYSVITVVLALNFVVLFVSYMPLNRMPFLNSISFPSLIDVLQKIKIVFGIWLSVLVWTIIPYFFLKNPSWIKSISSIPDIVAIFACFIIIIKKFITKTTRHHDSKHQ